VISYRESLPRLACLIIRPKSDFWTIVVRSVRPYVGDYIDLRFFFLRRSQVIEKCCNIAKTDRSKIEPKVILGLPSNTMVDSGLSRNHFDILNVPILRPFLSRSHFFSESQIMTDMKVKWFNLLRSNMPHRTKLRRILLALGRGSLTKPTIMIISASRSERHVYY